MPQITKGGKFIFGLSIINDDYSIQLPSMAIEEYDITIEGKVILISGSKRTGGFCVSRKGLIEKSEINGLLTANPILNDYKTSEGEFIQYKGRRYCWLNIQSNGILRMM